MGSTPGAVKLRAHRAYEALRGLLAGRFGPPVAPVKTGQGAP
jgi:hypothetical protein